MGRKAAVRYEEVKAVFDALRAEGAKPTIDQVWEALNRAGSKGTIHRLVKQCQAELDGTQKTPESLRLLPPGVQQVILAFADEAAATARGAIEAELLRCRQDADSLASDNERLAADVLDLRAQLAQAGSDKAAAEGRAAQLASELAAAREEAGAERAAAEQARAALTKAELRLESFAPLEEELRKTRFERDAQREARTEAERAAAVLGSQEKAHEERVQELKSSLASMRDACALFELKKHELAEALERERQARAVAERDLAVLTAVQGQRSSFDQKSKKKQVQQGALWPADGKTSDGC